MQQGLWLYHIVSRCIEAWVTSVPWSHSVYVNRPIPDIPSQSQLFHQTALLPRKNIGDCLSPAIAANSFSYSDTSSIEPCCKELKKGRRSSLRSWTTTKFLLRMPSKIFWKGHQAHCIRSHCWKLVGRPEKALGWGIKAWPLPMQSFWTNQICFLRCKKYQPRKDLQIHPTASYWSCNAVEGKFPSWVEKEVRKLKHFWIEIIRLSIDAGKLLDPMALHFQLTLWLCHSLLSHWIST